MKLVLTFKNSETKTFTAGSDKQIVALAELVEWSWDCGYNLNLVTNISFIKD